MVGHAAGVDLHEADAALDHAAGGDTLAGDMIATFVADAVEFFDVVGFPIDIEGFGSGGLHAVGEFEAFDAGFEFGIAGAGFDVLAVEFFEEGELAELLGIAHVGGPVEVFDGIAFGPKPGALVNAGKEAGAPIGGGAFGEATVEGIGHDDKGGEVAADAAEAVGGPGSDARKAHARLAGVHHEEGGAVVV